MEPLLQRWAGASGNRRTAAGSDATDAEAQADTDAKAHADTRAAVTVTVGAAAHVRAAVGSAVAVPVDASAGDAIAFDGAGTIEVTVHGTDAASGAVAEPPVVETQSGSVAKRQLT